MKGGKEVRTTGTGLPRTIAGREVRGRDGRPDGGREKTRVIAARDVEEGGTDAEGRERGMDGRDGRQRGTGREGRREGEEAGMEGWMEGRTEKEGRQAGRQRGRGGGRGGEAEDLCQS